ncbi:DUF2490 domain-containing protein [Spirosoma utsteinense]|uniref:DUF2490 domain-containing protein n=1 Tax=Spirosoma utsteinense TaxID=2585773 RepID=A0ABR6W8I2_9BACT|nr:DUF2490 domain-containing protein [Spirosoma utsteinense]MBC3787206.1 hypothetical protein [Spirosoma utsteinense]MBC3792891.1 hypothetical protein [Spirosoma utsteinense]
MKKIALLTVLCLLAFSAFSQQNRIIERNNVGWYTYNGDHKLAGRWQLHTEYQWRRIDFIRTWQQSLARLGLVYKLTDRVQASGGYTLFTTYPYGNYPSADAGVPTPEHRIYEDIQVSDKFGRLELNHRIRLEQRWLSQPSEDNPRRIADWEYQHRVRYQLSATYPLSGPTIDDGEFYLNAFDELFISFGRNVGANVFNQNRLSGGLGYQVTDKFKLELNYFSRIVQHAESEPVSNKPIFDIDTGVRLNVNYDLDFSRK